MQCTWKSARLHSERHQKPAYGNVTKTTGTLETTSELLPCIPSLWQPVIPHKRLRALPLFLSSTQPYLLSTHTALVISSPHPSFSLFTCPPHHFYFHNPSCQVSHDFLPCVAHLVQVFTSIKNQISAAYIATNAKEETLGSRWSPLLTAEAFASELLCCSHFDCSHCS